MTVNPITHLLDRRRRRVQLELTEAEQLITSSRAHRIARLEWELGLPGAERPKFPKIPTTRDARLLKQYAKYAKRHR